MGILIIRLAWFIGLGFPRWVLKFEFNASCIMHYFFSEEKEKGKTFYQKKKGRHHHGKYDNGIEK